MAERRPPRVCAIVIEYKLGARTCVTVEALQASCQDSPFELRVFVLENAAVGAGSDALRALGERAGVHVEVSPSNVGYCAGVNRGLAHARALDAEYVLFLNNDVAVGPGFLAPMVSLLANDPSVAGVGPTILWPDGRVWCQGANMRFGPNLNVLVGHGGQPAPTTLGPQRVDYLPGACALYRRAELEGLGGLDESYFMYMEDCDLGARLRGRGRQILWLPWVRVEHDASASSGGGRSPMRKYMTACNAARFLRAHGTPRLWLAFVIFDLLLGPAAVLAGTPLPAAWAKTRGAWAGLFGRAVTVQDVTR